jgi:hypothetical protein
MNRTSALAMVLVASLILASSPTQAQPMTERLRTLDAVNDVLSRVAEALPAPGASLRANIVPSTRYAARVSGDEVTVTTRFLRDTSRDALAALVVYQLLPDPVAFAITMHRAGFDGPAGLIELTQRQIDDIDTENLYRAAANVAYDDMIRTINENSFWTFARPGFHLMYRRVIDASVARYYDALRAYDVYLAGWSSGDMPPIPPEFIQAVVEVAGRF